jgi:hypothetical protein
MSVLQSANVIILHPLSSLRLVTAVGPLEMFVLFFEEKDSRGLQPRLD